MSTNGQEAQAHAADQSARARQLQIYDKAALSPTGAFVPSTLTEAVEVAKLLASSGLLPKQYDGNVGAVLVAMQMGAEVGLPPMAAIQNIAVINGRPSLWGDAMLAVCMAHPKWGGIEESGDAKTATCTVWRKGDEKPRTVTFTIEDARTAGLANKDTYKQYPARMLQMRARAFALRDKFPDALRGLASAEEMEDVVDAPFQRQADLTEGTHKFGFAKQKQEAQAQPAEPPHDEKTGEVKAEAPKQEAKAEKPAADKKAGF